MPDKKTLRIHKGGSVASDDAFDFGAWRITNPCEKNRFHVMCVEFLLKSTLNGSYVVNFDSTASLGSDQRLTLGNILDGGDVPFLGTIAADRGRDNESAMS